ncbi:hypothetical protein LOTGIDRAFT_169615, partial [Lottia gigantea]
MPIYKEDEDQSQIKQEKEHDYQEKSVDDLDIEEARIRGMSLDSPRDSGNRTPDYDKIQEEEKVYGRKIDAYSSEEEDLNGPDSTIVEVENDEDLQKAAMTIKIKKGNSQSSGEKSRKDQIKDVKHSQMKTSKSAPSNTPGGGKKKTPETRKKTAESSDSEELTPRRQQVLTPLSTDQKSRTPSPQNKPGSPIHKHLEGQTKSKGSPKKESKPASPVKKPSPVTSPELLHTVWDEESEVVQSPDEDWNQKRQNFSEQIMKEFGKKAEDSTYMADDEDTERTEQSLDRGTSEARNERVAGAIIDTFGKDAEQNEEANSPSKLPLIAEAILKNFGNDPKVYDDDSQKRVASAIIDTYGKDSEAANAQSKDQRITGAIIDTFGQDKEGDAQEGNIADQILKQFGGNLESEHDSSQKINNEDSQQLDPEKHKRIADEMQKHFGQDPVKPNLEEDQPTSGRISEEILKQFGGKDKNERVAEEIVKLYGQDKDSSSDKPKKSISESREWRKETEVKQTKNEQRPLGSNDQNSESTTSTEKEILARKRESQEFFQPAIEKKYQQQEATKSKISISSKSEEEKTNLKSKSLTVESSELSTSTQSSAITPDTTTEPTTTQESSTATKTESSTTKPTTSVSDSEDTSSDSDSDTTSESDSESSLTSSSSSDNDTATNTNTSARTPRPPDNGVKTEQKQQNIEPGQTSDATVTNKESEANEDQNKEGSKETNVKPIKSVTFRNTPEPFTYHVSDTESENMQYGGNDPDQVGDGEPGQRPATSMNTSVKLHGGSIKHLLQDENDIHLDSISLDKHQ